jgi:hypothetical protein
MQKPLYVNVAQFHCKVKNALPFLYAEANQSNRVSLCAVLLAPSASYSHRPSPRALVRLGCLMSNLHAHCHHVVILGQQVCLQAEDSQRKMFLAGQV